MTAVVLSRRPAAIIEIEFVCHGQLPHDRQSMILDMVAIQPGLMNTAMRPAMLSGNGFQAAASFRRRQRFPAMPAMPMPRRVRVEGSGTGLDSTS